MKKILTAVGIVCFITLTASANVRISFKGRCPTFADSIKNCCGTLTTDAQGNISCPLMCEDGEVCTPAGCCQNGAEVYQNASGSYQCCMGVVCGTNCCEDGQECLEGVCCQTGQVLCNGACQDKPTPDTSKCEKLSDDECSIVSKCADTETCDGAGNCVEAVVCEEGEKICGTDEKWCCASDNECGDTVGQCCDADRTTCCDGTVYQTLDMTYECCSGQVYRRHSDTTEYMCCPKEAKVKNLYPEESWWLNECCYSEVFYNPYNEDPSLGLEKGCCMEAERPKAIRHNCHSFNGTIGHYNTSCYPDYINDPNCCEKAETCSSNHADIQEIYENGKLVRLECVCQ